MYLQSEIISTCPASCPERTVLFTVSAFGQSHEIESKTIMYTSWVDDSDKIDV